MWPTILGGLSDAQLQLIQSRMTQREIPPRSLLLLQGEKAGCISVIVSGRVRSLQTSLDGRESSNVYGKGTALGLISVMLDEPAYASLESIDRTVISQLGRTDLLQLMEMIPGLSLNVSHTLARFCVTCAQRKYRAEEHTLLRLAQVLHDLATLDDSGQCGEIRGLTQQDLATMVNASRSWVAIKLGSLEELGLLTYRRAVIAIPDVQALERYSRGLLEWQAVATPALSPT